MTGKGEVTEENRMTEKNGMAESQDISVRRAGDTDMTAVIDFATKVFNGEQNIPEALIPIAEEQEPMWWCAEAGGELVGISACWKVNDQWHWGRFAVNKNLRGKGIGSKIASCSLHEIFELGAGEIIMEARDITVKMLKNFGCRITGEPEDFFGEAVTPIVIRRCDFPGMEK